MIPLIISSHASEHEETGDDANKGVTFDTRDGARENAFISIFVFKEIHFRKSSKHLSITRWPATKRNLRLHI